MSGKENYAAHAYIAVPDVYAQIRDEFRRNGVTVKEWAEKNGFAPSLVYAVFEGKRKCVRGESHRIAIALGVKRN